MPFSPLEIALTTERRRKRAARDGGFSVPTLCYEVVSEEEGPFLVTNMRGKFLQTRRNAEGEAPFAFTECPVGEEGPLLQELHRCLCGWASFTPKRAKTIAGGIGLLEDVKITPKTIILSHDQLDAILGRPMDSAVARKAVDAQGYVTIVNDIKIVLGDLSPGTAFVLGAPELVGTYTRVGDYVGIMVKRADRAIVVVDDGLDR